MSLTAGTRLGPYEILAPVGAGGMGEVYRARDARLDRTVAVKVLPQHVLDHPTRRQRFERESRAASRLSHPHICAVYDVGQQGDVHFIVMEYLAGQTLTERLRGGALPISDAVRCAIEIADALDHAHRQGIVHRDLKPANIMLTPSGAKLLDFGLARFEQEPALSYAGQPTESLSSDGAILGTLHYMAPEQLEGREVDARADIFSLGAVLYEMVSGRQPFAGATPASVIAAILNRDPPRLTHVHGEMTEAGGAAPLPPLVEHVVFRCLAKNPDERWQSAADVRQELKWIAQGNPELRATPSAATMRRIKPLAWSAAAVLAIVGLIALGARSGWFDATSSPPTFKQLTFRRGFITEAQFAPDGQTVLYSAAWDGGPVQLYEKKSGGPESQSFGPSSTGLASVSSTGELAVLLGCRLEYGWCVGTLASMPSSGGAPRELRENVSSADWAPDGRQLAVIHQADGEYRLEFPSGTPLYKSTGRMNSLRFAPDGQHLAFLEYPVIEEEIGSVKVIDLAGTVRTVSSGWQTVHNLEWSATGDEVWFTGSRTGKASSLYAVTLTGTLRTVFHTPGDILLSDVARDGRVLLTYGPVRARMVMWSNDAPERELSSFDWPTVADLSGDGRTVLFHEWGEAVGAKPTVYLRRVNESAAVKLGDGKALSLSPDGRWALALVDMDRPQLVMMPTGTGQSRVIPTEGITDVYWAKWFPDSRQILLTAADGQNVPQSYIQDVETGRLKPIGNRGTLGMLVAPDGRRILALDPSGSYYLWPVDGGTPMPVSGLGREDRPFQWSADGRVLYVRNGDEDVLHIDRYTLATGHRELWHELVPRDPAGVFGVATGRGEFAMTADGRSAVFTYWTWNADLFLVEGAR